MKLKVQEDSGGTAITGMGAALVAAAAVHHSKMVATSKEHVTDD